MAKGRYEEAETAANRAMEALARAENLQRSNPRVLLSQAQTRQLQLAITIDLAREARPAFDRAVEASDRAIAVDSGSPRAWSSRSALFRLWGIHLLRQGADPSAPLKSAAEAAEEAILDSMFRSDLMEGKDGRVAEALPQQPAGATVYCLATYTAMLGLQGALARRGLKRPYWEE